MIRSGFVALLALAAPVAAKDLSLALPIDCSLGENCFVQQFVDRDAGPEHSDYSCGSLTYEGHKGTDFALPNLAAMTAGVDVLAAASGRVVATRDDMADILQGGDDAPDITDKECGNGLVIRHSDGWETQYCHLKLGSIIVERGQEVSQGDVLGEVGLSGKTEFPHVHLSVRKNGNVIDPYDADENQACDGTDLHSLWQTDMPYIGAGVISLGFNTAVPKYAAVKSGGAARETLAKDAPALVLWGYAYGGHQGDILELLIDGPNGEIIHHQARLKKSQAQFYRAAGKRNKGTGWPVGNYTGIVRLLRDDVELGQSSVSVQIK